jgi:hypothetical protein
MPSLLGKIKVRNFSLGTYGKSSDFFLRRIVPSGLRLETGIHMEKSEVRIKCISLLATLLSQWDDIKSDMLVRGPLLEVFLHMATRCPKGHPL